MNAIATLATAAEKVFDATILEVAPKKSSTDSFYIYARRRNPPLPDRPYMYCTGYINEESKPVFIWGHYDLESPADFINHK